MLFLSVLLGILLCCTKNKVLNNTTYKNKDQGKKRYVFSTFEILVEISKGAASPDGATPRDALDEKLIGFRPLGAKHIQKRGKTIWARQANF